MKVVLILSVFLICFSSCTSRYQSLVEKADEEALNQKSELAKYLYLQVIQNHRAKDDTRYRALKGLAMVSLTQLFDYPTAVEALDKIFLEYSQVSRYQAEIYDLRLKASLTWRLNLNQPRRALDVLTPLIADKIFRPSLGKELGEVYLALGDYQQAQHWFKQVFEKALEKGDCSSLMSSQLQIIQSFSLDKQCEEALKWAAVELPSSCEVDRFALVVERANCYELQGDVGRAISLYEDVLKDEPQNMRAHFFMKNIKRRQKEKLQK